MDADAIWMMPMLVVAASALFWFFGWATHNEVKIRRWHRKQLGVASEELIERVLHVIDYTLTRESGDQPDKLAFVARWQDIRSWANNFEKDHIRISIEAKEDSDLRQFLETAFNKGAVQLALRPFEIGATDEKETSP